MRNVRATAILAGAIMAAGAMASSVSEIQKKLPFKSAQQKEKLDKAEKKRLRKMAQRARLLRP